MAKPDWIKLEPGEVIVYKSVPAVDLLLLGAILLLVFIAMDTLIMPRFDNQLFVLRLQGQSTLPAWLYLLACTVPLTCAGLWSLWVYRKHSTVWITTRRLLFRHGRRRMGVRIADISAVRTRFTVSGFMLRLERKTQPPLDLPLGLTPKGLPAKLKTEMAGKDRSVTARTHEKPDWIKLEPGEEFVGEFLPPDWRKMIIYDLCFLPLLVAIYTLMILHNFQFREWLIQYGGVYLILSVFYILYWFAMHDQRKSFWLTTRTLIYKHRRQPVSIDYTEISGVEKGSFLKSEMVFISRHNKPRLEFHLGSNAQEFTRELTALLASEARHTAKGGR
jgi:hypothetical protein